MSVIQAALREADKPANKGEGFLFRIETKSGKSYRAGVYSDEKSVKESGVVHLDLWALEPIVGQDDGPIGRGLFLAEDAIESVEIEW
ncbi:hypothetical protein [Burkholderia contaminans]|uniref:Uncharacterized protein n=1 Tax=Burkholderia contaminans TaxID=488447 RepID=A0A3N8QQR5_9BURK|nr:hypothetical protein [Burkholderia contaminans]RQT26025.1 hypothetical protein DF037_20255 [Burkholderia contaminans]